VRRGDVVVVTVNHRLGLRKLVSRAFTPRRVSVLEDHIRAVCARLLDEQVGAGRGARHGLGRPRRAQEPEPDVLDVRSTIDVHVTFGYGIHFCLGAALARMENRIGIDETIKRWPEWTVDRDNTVLLYTSTVRGPLNLFFEV
jgi:cytochrome P450